MTILPNQSILDAVLTRYGSLEAAMVFCRSNGIALSHLPEAGTQYGAPVIKGNAKAAQYLSSRSIELGTAGIDNGVCGMITGIGVADITATTATGLFVAGEGAIGVEWAVSVDVPVSGTIVSPFVTSVLLEGLAPATHIKFWVRTVCMGAVSEWNTYAFTTAAHDYAMQIVLRPVMMHVSKDAGITSDYVLNYVPDAGFVNMYDLLEDWQPPAVIARTTKEAIDASGTWAVHEEIGLTELSGNMASKTLQFMPHAYAIGGSVFVWYPIETSLPNAILPLFIDVEGNRAPCAPVLVNDTGFGDFYTMLGTMDFGEGHLEGEVYIQPVLIGHVGDNPFFNLHAMKLIKWDGDDYILIGYPMPGDTVLLTLHPGTHEFLLCTVYKSPDATDSMPISFNGVVLNIAAP